MRPPFPADRARPLLAASIDRVVLVALVAIPLALAGLGSVDPYPGATSTSAPVDRQAAHASLWGGRSPARVLRRHRARAATVGTRFSVRRESRALGVRFWTGRRQGGRRSVAVRGPAGRVLARGGPVRVRRAGWHTARLDRAVLLRRGTSYSVTIRSANGRFVVSPHRAGRSPSALLDRVGWRSGLVASGGALRARRVTTWVEPRVRAVPVPPADAGPDDGPSVGCADDPVACGYPGAANTGPRPGEALVRVPQERRSGDGWKWNDYLNAVVATRAGATIARLDVSGAVVIDLPDVTLRDSRIAACGGSWDSDAVAIRYRPSSGYRGARARVVRNRIDGTPAGCDHRARSGVRDVFGAVPGALVQGNEITGTGNGITIENEGLIVGNWIHTLGHLPGDHHSGISNHGGADQVTVRHNTVLLHDQRFRGGGGVSGALTSYSDFGRAQNVTLEDNLISGGSYVVYGGNSGDDYRASRPATGIVIRDNRFVCGDWLYGPVAAFDSNGEGNTWSGNVCDGTGRPVRH